MSALRTVSSQSPMRAWCAPPSKSVSPRRSRRSRPSCGRGVHPWMCAPLANQLVAVALHAGVVCTFKRNVFGRYWPGRSRPSCGRGVHPHAATETPDRLVAVALHAGVVCTRRQSSKSSSTWSQSPFMRAWCAPPMTCRMNGRWRRSRPSCGRGVHRDTGWLGFPPTVAVALHAGVVCTLKDKKKVLARASQSPFMRAWCAPTFIATLNSLSCRSRPSCGRGVHRWRRAHEHAGEVAVALHAGVVCTGTWARPSLMYSSQSPFMRAWCAPEPLYPIDFAGVIEPF